MLEFTIGTIWSWAFLRVFLSSLIQSPYSQLVCLHFLFLHDSVLVNCMFLGIYPFLDFQFDGVCLLIFVSHNPLYFCGVIVMSPISFLILFVWTLFFLVNLVTSLSILFIISKSQLLFSLIFSIHSLVSISIFFSSLIFVNSFYL